MRHQTREDAISTRMPLLFNFNPVDRA